MWEVRWGVRWSLHDAPVVSGYGNTQLASRHLASEGACSLHGFVAYNDEHAWTVFTDLESAVRQGPRAAAGRPAEDPSQVANIRTRVCTPRVPHRSTHGHGSALWPPG